jgi:Tfp pilus assembly protein PilN
MPDSVVLTSLEVEHNSVKKKVPKKDDPQKTVDIDVLVRTLRLTVSGRSAGNCDEAVRDFRDRLRASAFLGPRLENIGVSQKSETVEGRDVVSYEISCIFRPGF